MAEELLLQILLRICNKALGVPLFTYLWTLSKLNITNSNFLDLYVLCNLEEIFSSLLKGL